MPLLRVQYDPSRAPQRNPLAIEYLTPGEDYYIGYSANWKPHPWLGHTTQFTSATSTAGTFIDTYKVQQALELGILIIKRGLPRPAHIR